MEEQINYLFEERWKILHGGDPIVNDGKGGGQSDPKPPNPGPPDPYATPVDRTAVIAWFMKLSLKEEKLVPIMDGLRPASPDEWRGFAVESIEKNPKAAWRAEYDLQYTWERLPLKPSDIEGWVRKFLSQSGYIVEVGNPGREWTDDQVKMYADIMLARVQYASTL
jgi:hypothetical protein